MSTNNDDNEKKSLPSVPDKNLPTIPGGDGFDVEDRQGGYIIGKRIKFNDGVYIVNKTEILSKSPKPQFVVTGVVTCWIRWEVGEDGKSRPVQHLVTQSGQKHPKREELGYLDESKWPISKLSRKPEDPLKDSRYLYMHDPKTGVEYTFITDTWGGRIAISGLKQSIKNIRKEYPTAEPLVEFSDGVMPNEYKTPVPDLKIIKWNLGERKLPELAPAPTPTPQLSQGAAEKPPFDDFCGNRRRPS